MLVNLESVRSQNRHAVTFTKAELKAILAVYSFQVMKNSWRDYAVDFTRNMAVFSIFRSSKEQPLVSIVKTPANTATGFVFEIFFEKKRLSRTAELDKSLRDLQSTISD